MRKLTFIRAALLAVALTCSASPSLLAQSSRLVVASGLNNPRGLIFGPDGALYVAEAGTGGTGVCVRQPAAPPGTLRCSGLSGSITRIRGLGDQQRVVVGLPSLAGPTGAEAIGPHDIGFGFGSAWVTVGFGDEPSMRAPLEAAGIRMGRLVEIRSNGQATAILDSSAHEEATNPDGNAVDSNPYGLLIQSNRAVFADAGANALVNVSVTGAMSTLAVFPNTTAPNPFGPGTVPLQAVPTTIAAAPDGSLFVGQLTGFPFPVGGASVFRVPAAGGTPQVVATGFTNIIDIAADSAGNGYVLEHDADGLRGAGTAGRLIRVNANGTQTVMTNANLTRPGGVAIGPDGALYITNMSTSAGGGEVIRLVP